jgi:hypothetical protein
LRRFEIAGQGSRAKVPIMNVEPQPKARVGSLLRGLGALAATACAVAAIAVIGIVATTVALVLVPLASLAVWALGASPVQGMERTKSQ